MNILAAGRAVLDERRLRGGYVVAARGAIAERIRLREYKLDLGDKQTSRIVELYQAHARQDTSVSNAHL